MKREPKKAYAVSSGEYSDYGVWAIFDSEERAKAYLREQGYEWKVAEAVASAYGTLNYGPHWCKPPVHDEDLRIEEFDYYDGDVLPLSG